MIRNSPEASSSPIFPLPQSSLFDSDNIENGDDSYVSVDTVTRSSPIMVVEADLIECDEPLVNAPISPVSLTPSPSPSPAPLPPEVSVTETEDVFEFSEIDTNRYDSN